MAECSPVCSLVSNTVDHHTVFANTQGYMLLLAHAQFQYHNAAEVTITIAIVELYYHDI